MTQATIFPIIRTGKLVAKGLKGKNEQPALSLATLNGEKFIFFINSKDELEHYQLGKEYRVRLEQVPIRLLDDSMPIPSTSISSNVLCPKGVLADEYGKAEICPGCEHLKEGEFEPICDLTSQKTDEENS